MFIKIIIFTTFLLSLFTLFSGKARAAEFRLEPNSKDARVGDEFLVTVLVDTEGEEINAFQGNVVFPEELLELKGIQEQGSIINLWAQNPPNFSGLTPGGYRGRGVLFSFVLQAKAEGEGVIAIEQGQALLNDGQGTPAALEVSNFQFSILDQEPNSEASRIAIQDTEPPEPFELYITQDPNVFDGQPFLVFAAQDKNAGIAYYEVSFVRNGRETVWERAKAPFLLEGYGEIDEVRVKAVDRAGNERIASLSIPPRTIPLAKFLLWGNIGMLIGIGTSLGFWLWRRKR